MSFPKWAFKLVVFCLVLASNTWGEEVTGRFKVKSVTFEGNQAFTERRLQKVLLTRPSRFLSPSHYHPEILDEDLNNLVLFYQQNGYLDAQVTDHHVTTDSVQKEVGIHIQVTEGELTQVEGVAVFGNNVFADSLLLQMIKINPGDPLRQKRIEEATLSILSLYADEGYLDTQIKPDVRIDSVVHRALIDFVISEKVQFKVGEIRMEGLEKTKPGVVKRELLFARGEVIRYSRLLESQRRLYLTGLFYSVFIQPQPAASGDPTTKDILLDLKENKSIEFNLAAGYGSVEKARGRMEIFNNNLAGSALKAGISAKVSFISRGLEFSFTDPWTFGLRLRTDANFMLEYLEEPGYDISHRVGRLVIGRAFGKRSNISFGYRYQNAKIKNIQVSDIPDQLETNLRTLAISLILDTRDNLFNSTQGTYFEWKNELAGSFLRGTDTFVRSVGRIRYFYSWKRSTIFATALEVGWMDFFGESRDIPLSERFYAGGPNSLRGFGYQLVGPLDAEGDPFGGRFKLVWNLLEIRQALYKMFGMAIFADVGNVWSKPKEFRLDDVRTSAGFGLRATTAVGILRLDYGINLQPKKGEPGGKLYFSMGHAF
jgi:outer membrane protein insertion porin family